MSEIKRFSSQAPRDGDPIPFEVEAFRYRTVTHPQGEHGEPPRTERVTEGFVETFHAKPDVSGGVLVQIELISPLARRGSNSRGGDAVFDLFDAALVDQDRQRFRDFINDPEVYIHGSVLTAIASWLFAEYSGRPTKRPGS